jgi:uncharacterized protein (DUF1810 family)
MASLQEFVEAQERVWTDVLREMRVGRKTSHWIWWVFPQLSVLGRSKRAVYFGLSGLSEARAYLAHPLLGPRLIEVTELLLSHQGSDPVDILGSVDALKVRSCMTLFESVPDAPEVFGQVLNSLYHGERCHITEHELEIVE